MDLSLSCVCEWIIGTTAARKVMKSRDPVDILLPLLLWMEYPLAQFT